MNHNSSPRKILFLSIVILFTLACVGSPIAATATPVPPTAANTSLPTNTPRPPTETPIPATPTAAPIGVPVGNDSFEVTVIDAIKRDRVYPGGTYFFTPGDGYMLIDVGVKVKNLKGSPASVLWQDIYVLDSNGDLWYSSWGTFKESTAGKELDPFGLGLSDVETDPSGKVTFNNDIYLRLVYHVLDNDPTVLLFGFGDSPQVEIEIE